MKILASQAVMVFDAKRRVSIL